MGFILVNSVVQLITILYTRIKATQGSLSSRLNRQELHSSQISDCNNYYGRVGSLHWHSGHYISILHCSIFHQSYLFILLLINVYLKKLLLQIMYKCRVCIEFWEVWEKKFIKKYRVYRFWPQKIIHFITFIHYSILFQY